MDRELLFSLVALQQGLLSVDRTLEVWRAKLAAGNIGFADACLALELLQQADIERLEGIVDQALEREDGLAQLLEQMDGTDVDATMAGLLAIGDHDLTASLAKVNLSGSSLRLPSETTTHDQQRSQRYRVIRPLEGGRGGMGVIAIARDDELGRHVAVKQIQSHFSSVPELRERFQVEARITGNLEHPGIIPVYGFGVSPEGAPYYAMRLVEGDNLTKHIEDFHSSSFPDSDKYESVRFRTLIDRLIDVAQAISYAHSRGILHRDLKPGNILLGRYGETLVIDWGLAGKNAQSSPSSEVDGSAVQPASLKRDLRTGNQSTTASNQGKTENADLTKPLFERTEIDQFLSAEDAEKQGQFFGTPGFAPPEQAEGRREEIDQRSDVFALGGILYQILTGRTPFLEGRSTRQQVIDATRRGDVTRPRTLDRLIPRGLEAICLKCLRPDKAERYFVVQELIADLERWKADLPVSVLPETPKDKAVRWLRKHPRVAVGIVVGVLLAIILGSWANWINGRLRLEVAERQRASEQAVAEEARADAEQSRADAEATKAKEESALREKTQAQAELEHYFAVRSEFERLVLARPGGWLASAKGLIAELSESKLAARDPVWLASARRQMLFANEVLKVADADQRHGFGPVKMQVGSSGKRMFVGQGKATGFVSLQFLLYDVETRQPVKTFSFSTKSSALDIFAGSFSGKPMSAEASSDVLISEKLGKVFALTSRGNLVVWNIEEGDATSKAVNLESRGVVFRLTLGEAEDRLFISYSNHLEMVDAKSDDFSVSKSWRLDSACLGTPIGYSKSGKVYLADASQIHVVDTKGGDAGVGRLPFGAFRLAYSPGAEILVCQLGNVCRIVDEVHGVVTGVIELEQPEVPDYRVEFLSISNNGKYLSVVSRLGDELYSEIWDVSVGVRLWRESIPEWWGFGMELLPTSKKFARIEGMGLSWWEVAGREKVGSIAMGSRVIHDFATSVDGKRMVVGRAGSLEIWEVNDLGEFSLLERVLAPGVYKVAMSEDGTSVVAVELTLEQPRKVFVWQESGDEAKGWREQLENVFDFVLFPHGVSHQALFVRSQSRIPSAPPSRIELLGLPELELLAGWDDGGLSRVVSGRGNVTVVACGKEYIYAGFRDGSLHRLKKDLSASEVYQPAFFNGARISVLQLPEDGDGLAVGTMTGELQLVEGMTLERIASVKAHNGAVVGIAWIDRERLMTAGTDGAIHCFRFEQGAFEKEWSVSLGRPVRRFSRSGDFLEFLLEGARSVERVRVEVMGDGAPQELVSVD